MMAHILYRNIGHQSNGILYIFQRNFHIAFIDNHVFRNNLNDIIPQLFHYLWGYTGPILNQNHLQSFFSNLA